MPNKYLAEVSGFPTEVEAIDESAGAGDAGKIPALNAQGVFDESFMPPGIVADTQLIEASEDLAAGDWVNIYNSTGAKVRKADASTLGKHAHGFVLAAVTSGNDATVYLEGGNNQVTGQTPGDIFLSTTPGLGTSTPPSASGNVVQYLGVAVSATKVNFEPSRPIVKA